jgi:hypothetical protein
MWTLDIYPDFKLGKREEINGASLDLSHRLFRASIEKSARKVTRGHQIAARIGQPTRIGLLAL